MKTVDELLLALYRSSMELAPGQHTQWVFGFLQSVLTFDSAGCSSLHDNAGEILLTGADTYHEEPAMLDEWQRVNREDPVLAWNLAHPTVATRFHASTLLTSMRDAGVRHYLQHNSHHQNGLVILTAAAGNDRWDGLGFYRAQGDRQFTLQDAELLQIIAPHVMQAIRINLQLAGVAEPPAGAITAIVRSDGRLRYTGPGVVDLLKREWSTWQGNRLPSEMMEALQAGSGSFYSGRQIEARAEQTGDIILVRLQSRSPFASLSSREMQAATMFGTGLSTKEIARQMGVAPNTARNFIQSAYRKLGVSDKAALAVMLSAEPLSR